MISLIVLASGFGSRYGSNKLMAEIDGQKMYLHILEKLNHLQKTWDNDSDIQVIVVSQYEEILNTAKQFEMNAVYNDEAAEGIAASVRLGVKCAADSEWFFFFTADQPYLQEDTIYNFVKEVREKGDSMASVHSGGTPGSPTAFHKKWVNNLMSLTGDVGGRKIMKQFPEEVFWYEISQSEMIDIDYSDRKGSSSHK